MKKKEKHPGFKKVAQKIARKQHIPIEQARKILAAATRKASSKAKRKNPRLKKVPGA